MLKRILTVVMLSCLVPGMAHAWVLNTWVKTAGGSIQVGSGTPQTSLNGSVNTSYKTNTAQTVTVAASTGYTISQVTYNGVVKTASIPTSYQVNGPSNQSVLASFVPNTYILSASVAGNSGGSANMTSISYLYGTKLTVAKKITFTPTSASFQVASITGVPSGATVSVAMPAAAGAPVSVTLPVGFTITGDIPLVATFTNANPVAVAGAAQITGVGSLVTLDGSGTMNGSGATSFQWTLVSGPAVTLVSANSVKANFTPTTAGTYNFSLTVQPGGSTSTTTVTVSADAKETVLIQCQNCHVSSNVVRATAAYDKWSASKHEANFVVCADCHTGANAGGHPGTVSTNICMSCHNATLGTSPAVNGNNHHGIADTLANTCYGCHNHDLGISGGTLTCTTCHNDPPTAGQYYNGTVKYTHPSAGLTCANCHAVPPTYDDPATPTHRDGTVEILTNNNACAVCHSYPPASSAHATAVGGTSPNCSTCHIYTGFNGATHNNGTTDLANLSCTSCHGMPPTTLTSLSTNVGPHPPATATNCALCHGYLPTDNSATGLHRNGTVNTLVKGAPHFNNSTSSSAYRASYVTSNAACVDCHNSNANNQTIRQQWAASGHAGTTALPWTNYDFKTRTTCERCHTTTGFIAYSTAKVTAAWGTASDKTKEVLTCVGCHSDVANGIVRTVTPNNPYADASFTGNVNVGTSNVCMDCHAGMNNGADIQIKVGTADFTNQSFVSPHYLTAGGSMQGKSGFNFTGRNYTLFTDNAHGKVGVAGNNTTGTDGPCVACHMSATAKHSLSPVTTNETTGAITALTTTVCANCHADTLPASTLDTKRVAFNNALDVLKAALQDKGFTYSPSYPYFAAKNWGAVQAGANVMGAAFNFKLFAAEPGAYTHNPEYAKQLIADSIEAVATGGSVTGSDISAYLDGLRAAGKLSQTQINSLNAFKDPTNSCSSCHSFPPATSSHATATTSPLNCSTCHAFTGMGGVTHNNGVVDLTNMNCNSCHGNPPSIQTIHTGGTVKYLHNQLTVTYTDCSQCHETPATYAATATHRDGSVEIKSNAIACSSCHGYPPATVAGGAAHVNDSNCANCHDYTTYSASTHNNGTVNFKTGTAACSSCHGYPPATQTIHANGAVKYNHDKAAVVYTDCSQCHATPTVPGPTTTHMNSTVDLLTTVNACNSCHSAPPATSAHTNLGALAATLEPFTCTACHTYTDYTAGTHNNSTVDLVTTLACDTCHGYPPMPQAQLDARVAGTFANARVEDYTNGGGHHSTHLSPTLSVSERFAPCLPCHPNSSHAQGGGTIVKTNVNVFSDSDLTFRFDETRAKRYTVATQSCSNVSCHYQASPSW